MFQCYSSKNATTAFSGSEPAVPPVLYSLLSGGGRRGLALDVDDFAGDGLAAGFVEGGLELEAVGAISSKRVCMGWRGHLGEASPTKEMRA